MEKSDYYVADHHVLTTSRYTLWMWQGHPKSSSIINFFTKQKLARCQGKGQLSGGSQAVVNIDSV